MLDIGTAKPLAQKALDLLETCSEWDNKASMKAHIVGLQGEKRRLRYLSREAKMIAQSFQHAVYDASDGQLELYPQIGSMDFSGLTTIQSTMNGIIEKLWKAYYAIHQVANEMVMACLKPLTCHLYSYAACLWGVISELQRARREYVLADWEYHHISRYQVSYYNVHDEYECKEDNQGYKDFKGE